MKAFSESLHYGLRDSEKKSITSLLQHLCFSVMASLNVFFIPLNSI